MPGASPTAVRAAIYLRISEDKTGEERGVERQLQDALQVVRERGWTVAGEPYQDNSISASKRTVRRPAYDRMVEDRRAGLFDAIVCYDLDRLTRQPRQLEDWIDAAEETGLAIVTTNGEADLTTDGGRMFARVKAAVARSEIERQGARHKRANQQRTEDGLPHGGRRRYGYEPDNVTPREEEAAIVRRCFAAIAAGDSLRSIVTALRAEDVPSGTGKGWGGARIRYMLLNPSYAGFIHVGEEALPSDKVTPIVSPELYEEVRAILMDEKRRTSPGPGRKHLASGLVACGVEGCTNRLNVHAGFYRCQIKTLTRSARVVDPTGARHASITVHILERHLRERMAEALLVTPSATLQGDATPAAAPLVARLEKIEKATAATMADRDDDLISPQAARTRLVQLRGERLEVEAALDAARASRSSSVSLAAMAKDVLPTGRHLTPRDILAAIPEVADRIAELDLDRQRDALQQLLSVTIMPGQGLRRVHVWHRIAEQLNPGPELSYD